MDPIFEALHSAMPVLFILAALAIIVKIVMVIYSKGLSLPAIFVSFFRVYSKSQRNTSSVRRKNFMRYNNYINFFLYGVIILFIILLIIYQGNIFYYPQQ
jgi:hypothetical protein